MFMLIGVLAPWSLQPRPSAQPLQLWVDIFATLVCRISFKHLSQSLKSHNLIFGILQLFETPPFVRPSHNFFFTIGILIYLLVRSPYNFWNPMTSPCGIFLKFPFCLPQCALFGEVPKYLFYFYWYPHILLIRSLCKILNQKTNQHVSASSQGQCTHYTKSNKCKAVKKCIRQP